MAHGGPDWGTEGPVSTIYSIQDLGELAARLKSIVTFDRRGNVIALDDFESGLSQWRLDGGPGYEITWNSQYSRGGAFSCKIQTAAPSGSQAWITKYMPYPVLTPSGVEFSFSGEQNWAYLTIDMILQTTLEIRRAGIRYNHSTSKLQYTNAFPVWHDIPDLDYASVIRPYAFDTLKVVVDFTTLKYKRLIINDREVDLSAYSGYTTAVGGTPVLNVDITLQANATGTAIGYIDGVIITQNEP